MDSECASQMTDYGPHVNERISDEVVLIRTLREERSALYVKLDAAETEVTSLRAQADLDDKRITKWIERAKKAEAWYERAQQAEAERDLLRQKIEFMEIVCSQVEINGMPWDEFKKRVSALQPKEGT